MYIVHILQYSRKTARQPEHAESKLAMRWQRQRLQMLEDIIPLDTMEGMLSDSILCDHREYRPTESMPWKRKLMSAVFAVKSRKCTPAVHSVGCWFWWFQLRAAVSSKCEGRYKICTQPSSSLKSQQTGQVDALQDLIPAVSLVIPVVMNCILNTA
jgi:hypothetical protein